MPPNHLFADIAPFLWPFVLLALGVALTPVSPISWSYSTWLLYIIPLIITIFAPIRRFSGPLRFAYLEYATKIASWTVSLLKVVLVNFKSIPTLALPALFLLPVFPILFFILFPALPIVWHYIAYHYRQRLNALTTSADKTIASLDLSISRAREAVTLAHTYEKQALHTVSTTRVEISRHSTDFGTPNNSEGRWRLLSRPGTLGAELAGKVLDTEKQMAVIEDASQEVRALSEQMVAIATEGDMVAGEKLAESTAVALKELLKRVNELRSTADQARGIWVEFHRRLNNVTSSASTTTSRLDSVITRARRADTLAHTYEKQALEFISTTRRTAFQTLALYDADFFESTVQVNLARQTISNEAERVRTIGNNLKEIMLVVDANIGNVECEAENIRALLEEAVAAAVDGDVGKGEKLTSDAKNSLQAVMDSLEELSSTSDDVHEAWIELSVRYWTIS